MSVNQPNLEGEVQRPTGFGGGSGGSPTNNPTIDLSQLTVTGGISGSNGVVLIFGTSLLASTTLGWKFDITNFDCEEDAEYDFRVEEIEVYRQPTVDSIVFRYRDLGRATFTVFIIGNVLKNSVVSKMVTMVIGGKADNKIYTAKCDLTCTFEAPQLIIQRKAFSGPLSLTKVMMEFVEGDSKPV